MGDFLRSLVPGSQKRTILCHWRWVVITKNLFFNLQASSTITTKKKTSLGLATRSRISGRLKACVWSVMDPNRKGKLVLDLTMDPVGLPPIPRGGPVCSWGPPRVAGITFRVAALILTFLFIVLLQPWWFGLLLINILCYPLKLYYKVTFCATFWRHWNYGLLCICSDNIMYLCFSLNLGIVLYGELATILMCI